MFPRGKSSGNLLPTPTPRFPPPGLASWVRSGREGPFQDTQPDGGGILGGRPLPVGIANPLSLSVHLVGGRR